MTPEQCQKLREAIPRSFPAIQAWWDRLKDDETRAAMTRRNTACLIDCDYDDCTAVIKDMLRSDVDPWPYDADKERSAAIIARAANDRRRERKEREHGGGEYSKGPTYTRQPGVLSIWEQAEKLAKYRASEAWTRDGEADLIAEMMGPEDANDKRNWIGCRECRDTGIVTVLSTIRWAKSRELDARPFILHTTAAAACSCQSAKPWRERKVPLPDYDVNQFVKIPVTCDGATAASLLDAWKRSVAASKRIGSFDDFNARNEEFI